MKSGSTSQMHGFTSPPVKEPPIIIEQATMPKQKNVSMAQFETQPVALKAHGRAMSSAISHNASNKDTARITYHCASDTAFEEREDPLNTILKKMEAEELPPPSNDLENKRVSILEAQNTAPATSMAVNPTNSNPVEVKMFNENASIINRVSNRPKTSLIQRRNQPSALHKTDSSSIEGIGIMPKREGQTLPGD